MRHTWHLPLSLLKNLSDLSVWVVEFEVVEGEASDSSDERWLGEPVSVGGVEFPAVLVRPLFAGCESGRNGSVPFEPISNWHRGKLMAD